MILRLASGQSRRNEIPVDVKKIMAGQSDDAQLIAGDVLVVPGSTGSGRRCALWKRRSRRGLFLRPTGSFISLPMEPLTPAPADRVLARVTPRVFVPPVSLGEASRPGRKAEQAGVLEYWRMVRRHKAAVIAVVIVGAMAGFLYTLPQYRIYQAHTTIEMQGLNEDFLGLHNVSPTVSSSSSYYPDFDIQTQVKILQSRSLLNSVVADLEGRKPPAELAAGRPSLRLEKGAENRSASQQDLWKWPSTPPPGLCAMRASGTNRIVEITCDSTQPAVAAGFANTLTREFIEQNLEARWKSTEYTGEWLTRQLQDIKIKLEKADEELNTYARSSGLTFTDEKTSVEEDKLRSLQKDLLQAQSDRVSKQSKYEMAQAARPKRCPMCWTIPRCATTKPT